MTLQIDFGYLRRPGQTKGGHSYRRCNYGTLKDITTNCNHRLLFVRACCSSIVHETGLFLIANMGILVVFESDYATRMLINAKYIASLKICLTLLTKI